MKKHLFVVCCAVLYLGACAPTQQRPYVASQIPAAPARSEAQKIPAAPSLDLVRFEIDHPLQYYPINKTPQKKLIYLTSIDYSGRELLLKNVLETQLLALGYEMAKLPEEAELFATAYIIQFDSKRESRDPDVVFHHSLKIQVIVEQRLKGGKIRMSESYDIKTARDAAQRRSNQAGSTDNTQNDQKAQESPREVRASVGSYSQFSGKDQGLRNTQGQSIAQAGSTAVQGGAAAQSQQLNIRSVDNQLEGDYYLYREEAQISVEVQAMNTPEADAQKQLIQMLGKRIAYLFDL